MALALFNDPFFEMERSLNRAMAPFFSAPTAVAPPRQSLALFDVKETENSYQLVAGREPIDPSSLLLGCTPTGGKGGLADSLHFQNHFQNLHGSLLRLPVALPGHRHPWPDC
jgi:hypothetical protein